MILHQSPLSVRVHFVIEHTVRIGQVWMKCGCDNCVYEWRIEEVFLDLNGSPFCSL